MSMIPRNISKRLSIFPLRAEIGSEPFRSGAHEKPVRHPARYDSRRHARPEPPSRFMTSAFSKEVEVIIANCSNSYHFVIREIPLRGSRLHSPLKDKPL